MITDHQLYVKIIIPLFIEYWLGNLLIKNSHEELHSFQLGKVAQMCHITELIIKLLQHSAFVIIILVNPTRIWLLSGYY